MNALTDRALFDVVVNSATRFIFVYEHRDVVHTASNEVVRNHECPVCLDPLSSRDVVACSQCKNGVHGECWATWTKDNNTACLFCRAG